jgi:uncharacterized membrane protein YfcA
MWVFALWLVCFYSAWLTLVVLGRHWTTLQAHWPIAVAMAAGSYVAGSTPMGGGTVGFPILVLLLHEPATLGRDFSFAIQSIGMTSASIFILCRRMPLEWSMLKWALAGTAIGTPLGVLFVAPHVPALWIKVIFAVVWASFGVLHFWKLRDIANNHGVTPAMHRFDRNAGLAIGLAGGATVASVTGVGIDMLFYAVLVLLCRADLKVAIPSSVVLMAFTSLVGLATKGLFTGVQPGVFENWLAAAPIVALGAPLGALIVSRIGRKPTLVIVSILCVGQFAWTMQQEWSALGWVGLALAAFAVAAMNLAFEWLWCVGARLGRRACGAQASPISAPGVAIHPE